jgi:hypothetical protein
VGLSTFRIRRCPLGGLGEHRQQRRLSTLSSRLRRRVRSPRGTLAPVVDSVIVVGDLTRSLASRGLDPSGTRLRNRPT